MKIKFWGACRTVTGSMHLLELNDGRKVLLECGIYQGSDGGFHDKNQNVFPCDPREIHFMILSHAHIDHCGNIPLLVKEGFSGKIFCTQATADLVEIMLMDSAKIQEQDVADENRWRKKKGKPLIESNYTSEDVSIALELLEPLPYKKQTRIDDGIDLTFIEAGHMLGSASVNLVIQEGDNYIKLGFTGDVGRPDRPILKNPEPMPQADFLISESTYGGIEHEPQPEAEEIFLQIIHETCVVNKGKLIIPAFSVGRTQDIVHILDKLENQGKLPRIPVYVDSPMAVNATRVFKSHTECFNPELVDYIRQDPEPFGFSRLNYVRTVAQSKELNNRQGPCVIISASGMMTAGRVVHHLANNIENPANTILVAGYCAKGTLGNLIVNKAPVVRIFGKEYQVKAQVKKLNSFSGHAGNTELYEFIRSGHQPDKLQKIFLVHGEEERQEMFRDFLIEKGYKDVAIPSRGDTFEL